MLASSPALGMSALEEVNPNGVPRPITPALKRGKTVLIAAHGNSIRGMLKYLDGISDDEILNVEVPTAIPLVYHLDEDLKPIRSEKAQTDAPLSGYFLIEAT